MVFGFLKKVSDKFKFLQIPNISSIESQQQSNLSQQNPQQKQNQKSKQKTQISQTQSISTLSFISQSQSSQSFSLSQQFQFKSITFNQTAPSYKLNTNLKQVQQPYMKSPYNCVVKILMYNKIGNQSSQKLQQGTGFMIGNGVVLTVAHNVMNGNNKAQAKNIYVYPTQAKNGGTIRIQVKNVQVPKQYKYCIDEYYGPNVYDIALLELDEQDMKKNKKVMPKNYLNIKYMTEPVKKKINLQGVGYPQQPNDHPDSCYLYQQTSYSYDQDGHYLYYNHKTTMGQSGMALFQKSDNSKSLDLIGIHKGIVKGYEINNPHSGNQRKQIQKTFGIIFNSFTRQIISQLAEGLNIQKKMEENYSKSKKMFEQLYLELKENYKLLENTFKQFNEEMNRKMNIKQNEKIQLKREIEEMKKEKDSNKIQPKKTEKIQQKDKVKSVNVNVNTKKNVMKKKKSESQESVQDDQNDHFKYDSRHVNSLIDQGKFSQAYGIANKAYKMCQLSQNQEQKQKLYSSYGDLARILLFCGNFEYQREQIKYNPQKAFQLAQIGSSFKQANSEYVLGYCYYHGKGTAVDNKEAIKYYKQSDKKNNKYAQYYLGLIYFNGHGQTKDQKKAFELFKKSAEQNYLDSKFQLAVCYLSGTGVAENRFQGINLLQQLKKLGHAAAVKRWKQEMNKTQKN